MQVTNDLEEMVCAEINHNVLIEIVLAYLPSNCVNN